MKKLFTMLCAFLCTIMAFADDVDILPESGELNELTGTVVTFDFHQAVEIEYVVALNGAFGADFVLADYEMSNDFKVVSVSLKEEYWGDPFMNVFYLNLVIPAVYDKETGEVLVDADGNPIEPMVSYQCENNFPARYLHSAPDPKNSSAESAYGNHIINYLYTQEVFLKEDAEALIEYTSGTEILYKEVSASDITVVQDEFTEIWMVNFSIENPDINPKSLTGMTIMFNGVYYVKDKGETVDVNPPTLTFVENPFEEEESLYNLKQSAPATVQQRIADSLVSNAEDVTVYNLQGQVVAKNANSSVLSNLPAGVYIVNGKKIAIK